MKRGLFFVVLLIVVCCVDLNAATLTTDSCSVADVQAKVTAAADGDTVYISATGSPCTWASAVTAPNTKGITIECDPAVTIVDNFTGNTLVINIAAAYFSRLTGCTFDAASVNKTGTNATVVVQGIGSSTAASFRVDHNTITAILKRGLVISTTTGSNVLYGVVDHNSFACPSNANCQSVTLFGGSNSVSGAWNFAVEFGTVKFTYIEDNVFTYAYRNDSGIESYYGARFVARFNTFHNSIFGVHGSDSGPRGGIAHEIYNNTGDKTGCSGSGCNSFLKSQFRSGTGFVFNNTYTGAWGAHIPDNYRSNINYVSGSVSPHGALGACTGSNVVDGNEGISVRGRHCIDQIGTIFTTTLDGTHTHVPMYFFGNTDDGSQDDAVVNTNCSSSSPAGTPPCAPVDVIENEDFFNQDSTFDGTTGVGVGVIASRPATCTGPDGDGIGGVGYWATNEGEWNSTNGATADGKFYKCTATNTWTAWYTPYTYPHPLIGSEDPEINLSGIDPDFGSQNTTVMDLELSGLGFQGGDVGKSTSVAVSGTGVTPSCVVDSDILITCDFAITAGATVGARSVTVTTDEGTSNAVTFTVLASTAPTLTTISPSACYQSTTCNFTLTGTTFNGGNGTITESCSGISFASIVVVSATVITAQGTVDSGASLTPCSLTVTTDGGTSNSETFQPLARPGGAGGAAIF